MRTLVFILVFAVSAFGQVQEFDVNDFSGGLVNGVSPLLMNPNQALVLENFDLTKAGTLRPRKGMSVYQTTATTEHILPFYLTSSKHLLTLRSQDYFTDDTANVGVNVLTQCEPCSTSVASGFYRQSRNWDYPFNLDYANINQRLVLAQSKSEMYLWDGGYAFPARPMGSGQAQSAVIDGGGEMSNSVSYRFAFVDTNRTPQIVKFTPRAHDSYIYVTGVSRVGAPLLPLWESFVGVTIADVCDSMVAIVNAYSVANSLQLTASDSSAFYIITSDSAGWEFQFLTDTAQDTATLQINGGPDTSNFSIPTWTVYPDLGKVIVWDVPQPADAAVDMTYVFREVANSGTWRYLRTLSVGTNEFLDNESDTTGDTAAFPWGPVENCQQEDCLPLLSPPGAPSIGLDLAASSGIFTGLGDLADSGCVAVGYSLVYLDSAGRQSLACPPVSATVSQDSLASAAVYKATLSDIPQSDNPTVEKKILLRGIVGTVEYTDDPQEWSVALSGTADWYIYFQISPPDNSSGLGDFLPNQPYANTVWRQYGFIWDGESLTAAAAVDTLLVRLNAHPTLSLYCDFTDGGNSIGVTSTWPTELELDVRAFYAGTLIWTQTTPFSTGTPYIGGWVIRDTLDDTVTTYVDSLAFQDFVPVSWCYAASPDDPESFCYDDSTIRFQPSTITAHGSRLFAAGDPLARPRLYYSEFGRMTTWPFDKYINLTTKGDWPTKLLSLEDRLLLFAQNSIYQLTGFSFFQFSLDQIVAGIGCSAPMSVAEGLNKVYFAHSSGIYRMSRFGGLGDIPLSIAIKDSYDSIGTRLQRAFGAAVGEEYWFSCAIGSEFNNRTYVFSDVPKPHWKVYTFGLQHATLFDTDTTSLDFDTKRWILARSDDTALYEWGYASDTLDGSDEFIRKYQSPFFFRDQNRERVMYVDIDGVGMVDSLMVTLYYWDDPVSVAVDSVVIQPDFSDTFRDRAKFNKTLPNCSVAIRDFGNGQYQLTGYSIGYIPWDEGFR